MPKVIYHVASSLDGFIADEDNKVDWLNKFNGNDKEATADFMALMSSFDAILLGGKTYDFTLDYGEWMSPGTPTWVFTNRDLKILNPCIQLTQESPQTICNLLDQQNLKRVWLMGGGQLAASFQNAGLIDEIQLAIIPVFLGRGIPLMGPTEKEPKLDLLKSKSYSNGIVSVDYKVRT